MKSKKLSTLDEEIITLLNSKLNEFSLLKNPSYTDRILPENINTKNIETNIIKTLYQSLFDQAWKERFASVSFLGPEGTFSHQAVIDIYGDTATFFPTNTIKDIFRNVERGETAYGVVPIENSIEGAVVPTMDSLMDTGLYIAGESTITVKHNLIGKGSLKTIKEVYSHPQILGQCRKWLANHLPEAELIETSSSSKAVLTIKNKKHAAAIGTTIASEKYKTPIIQKSIQDSENNFTRFLILSKHPNNNIKGKKIKTSVIFLCSDKPGALVEVLKTFKRYNINLTRIESRPSKRREWEYCFFVDLLGNSEDDVVKKALSSVKNKTMILKNLGSYPAVK